MDDVSDQCSALCKAGWFAPPVFLAAMRSTVSSLKDSCVSDFTACSEVSATMRPDAVPPTVWRSSAVPLAARNAAPQNPLTLSAHPT